MGQMVCQAGPGEAGGVEWRAGVATPPQAEVASFCVYCPFSMSLPLSTPSALSNLSSPSTSNDLLLDRG